MERAVLTRRELEVMNRRTLQYPLAIAEKDYFLALVLKIVYESPLRSKLVFKGGTALHHCYLDQMRFSEDLDFTSLDKNIKIEDVTSVFKPFDFIRIKKERVSRATIKIERLMYRGPLGQENSLKLEIDFLQNVVLPAREMVYNNQWRIHAGVRVMDIREIAAEKICAMSDRARYRDFYDFYQMMKRFALDMGEISDLIRRKEIRHPLSKASILSHWEVAKQEKSGEIRKIYFTETVGDEEIEKMIGGLHIGSFPANVTTQK